MLNCEKCGSEISDTEEKCPTCGWHAGPPNVRVVARREEKEALKKRYDLAIQDGRDKGSEQALEEFDENMKRTCAVINVDIDFLHQFIVNDKLLYTSYDLSIDSQTRKPALEKHDRDRKTIGAMMFGHYANEIRYAALSLDGTGLKSQGPCAVTLREIAILDRATLLEDNSYEFISKHNIPPRGEIPPGYRAAWIERHKLATAKLGDQISPSTTEQEHPTILLFGEGKRDTDRFIEVHIYGAFDNKAIASVKGSSSIKGKYERATLSRIKDYLKKMGRTWVEE